MMENNKLDCAVVRDLLPSYVDGVTSEETNRQLSSHLADCPGCSDILARMRTPEEPEAVIAPKEVDFLKKVRRRSTRKSLLVGIAMMVLGMGLILANVFAVGRKVSADSAAFTISTQGNTVYVDGNLLGGDLGFCRAVFSESAGVVNVELYTAPKTFFNRTGFSAQYEAHTQVEAVRSGDQFLWEDGVNIDPLTARLYAAQNPFVGDMPANSALTDILGVRNQFGEYTNALQTSQTPYGWTLCLETPIDTTDQQAARSVMAADSYMMLALIENLDVVTWQYTAGGAQQTYSVTIGDANAFAGGDVKEMAALPSTLQLLVHRLRFQWSPTVDELLQESGTFYLRVRNESSRAVSGVAVTYDLGGEAIGTRVYQNANGSSLRQGEEITFDFTPADFPDATAAEELLDFRFTLTVTTADGTEYTVCQGRPSAAKYAWTNYFTLIDDAETGFAVNPG